MAHFYSMCNNKPLGATEGEINVERQNYALLKKQCHYQDRPTDLDVAMKCTVHVQLPIPERPAYITTQDIRHQTYDDAIRHAVMEVLSVAA